MELNNLLEKHFKKGFSYAHYLNEVETLISQNKTSGAIQNDLMVNYTILAERRMRRWNKVLSIDSLTQEYFHQLEPKLKILIITEAWCGDASHLVPVFHRLGSINQNFEVKLTYRDENPELMSHFLTNNAKSIPIMIVMDEAYNFLFSWGPRPIQMQKRVMDYKNKPDRSYEDFLNEVQVWYNQDKGKSAIEEIKQTFEKFLVAVPVN